MTNSAQSDSILPDPVRASLVSADQCEQQVIEDRQAWWAVATILMTIVGGGLMLGLVTVLVAVTQTGG